MNEWDRGMNEWRKLIVVGAKLCIEALPVPRDYFTLLYLTLVERLHLKYFTYHWSQMQALIKDEQTLFIWNNEPQTR